MRVKFITQQIKEEREWEGDFSSLIDQINSQTTIKKKVITMDVVKRD